MITECVKVSSCQRNVCHHVHTTYHDQLAKFRPLEYPPHKCGIFLLFLREFYFVDLLLVTVFSAFWIDSLLFVSDEFL